MPLTGPQNTYNGVVAGAALALGGGLSTPWIYSASSALPLYGSGGEGGAFLSTGNTIYSIDGAVNGAPTPYVYSAPVLTGGNLGAWSPGPNNIYPAWFTRQQCVAATNAIYCMQAILAYSGQSFIPPYTYYAPIANNVINTNNYLPTNNLPYNPVWSLEGISCFTT